MGQQGLLPQGAGQQREQLRTPTAQPIVRWLQGRAERFACRVPRGQHAPSTPRAEPAVSATSPQPAAPAEAPLARPPRPLRPPRVARPPPRVPPLSCTLGAAAAAAANVACSALPRASASAASRAAMKGIAADCATTSPAAALAAVSGSSPRSMYHFCGGRTEHAEDATRKSELWFYEAGRVTS